MGNENLTQPRNRARIVTQADVQRMLSVDCCVHQERRNRHGADFFQRIIERCPECVFLLESSDGRACGWAHCLPLAKAPTAEQLADATLDVGSILSTNNILAMNAAMDRAREGKGNTCWVGLEAIDPVTRLHDYGNAVPLFLSILWVFYELWMREVFTVTRTKAAAPIMEYAGARKVRLLDETVDGHTVLWHFDRNDAVQRIASGLSVVYHTRWHVGPSRGRLGLSSREREVVNLILDGCVASKALAERLNVSENTVRSHLKKIYTKLRDVGELGEVADANRTFLVGYFRRHPEEVKLILPLPGSRSQRF